MSTQRWLALIAVLAGSLTQAAAPDAEGSPRRLASVTTVKAVGQVNLTVSAQEVELFRTDAKVPTAFVAALVASLDDVAAGDVTVTSLEACADTATSSCGDTNLVIAYEIASATRIVSLMLAGVAGIRKGSLESKLVKELEAANFLYSEPFGVASVPEGSINSTVTEGTADANVNAFVMPLSGVYKIENVRSQNLATMEAMSLENGGRLIQCTDHSTAARWRFDLLEHNVYTITNVASNKLVTVNMNSKANGVLLHQWDNPATHTSSQWALYEVQTGIHVLANMNSNKLMSVTMNSIESGVGLNQWANQVTNKASQWKLTPDASPPEDVTAHVNAGDACKFAHPGSSDQNLNGAASASAVLFFKLTAVFFACLGPGA